jgi:hypothetical protein
MVAIGKGTTHTIAYSYNGGITWTGAGNTMFTNTTTRASVKWVVNKFVAFSSGTNTLAYSYDGIRWMRLTNSTGIFNAAAYGGDCATALTHSITFPSNIVMTGNIVSMDGGSTWSSIDSVATGSSIVSSNTKIMGWNGRQYIFADSSGNIRVSTSRPPNVFSAEYATVSINNDPVSINAIKWNGEYWLMGGLSATNNRRHLLKSYDGWNWQDTDTKSYFVENYPCNGISWNGTVWVVSGQTSSTATTLLYSYDGVTWAQSNTIYGGGKVEWNGAYFLCGGLTETNGNTNISTSADGIHWNSTNIGQYGTVETILSNGSTWVIATNRIDGSGQLLTSYNGTTWIADTVFASSYRGGTWSGSAFVVNTNTNAIRTSYDGQTWNTVTIAQQTGYDVLFSSPEKGIAEIQQPTIIGGVGANHTMAYSLDGVLYGGLGKTIFSGACHSVDWNGSLWVSGGTGTHTLAYSYDGVRWVGLGANVFSQGCYFVTHNRECWVALGSGGNTIATSIDGKTWVGKGTAIFDGSGFSANWNGTTWIASGSGSTNTLAFSTDPTASNWTGLGSSVFSQQGKSVRWMMNKWIALGNGGNTLAYTTSISGQTGWTASPSPVFSSVGNSVFWNGTVAVAVGSGGNTIATSIDGITWTGKGNAIFSTSGNNIIWNNKRWIATGTGGNTVAISMDANMWQVSPDTNALFDQVLGVGTNSRMGVSTTNSGIRLHVNDRFAVNTPSYYDSGLSPDTVVSFQMNL